MKALIVGEYRNGKTLECTYELIAFAKNLGAQTAMFMVGGQDDPPKYDGKLYMADSSRYGEINPGVHTKLLLDVVNLENPDYVIFSHSPYGWDLAPRISFDLKAGQVSEVVDIDDGSFVLPAFNGKLRRKVTSKTKTTVVTVQSGSVNMTEQPSGTPETTPVGGEDIETDVEFTGYEEVESVGADLTKADIIVSAGRGIGKKENINIIQELADAMGGELAATRPVVDAGWADHSRQVGTSGQTVSPKLYMACGISGAIQHLAGMKKSEFIVAVNTDVDAPIGEVADVFVVADIKQFAPALSAKLKQD